MRRDGEIYSSTFEKIATFSNADENEQKKPFRMQMGFAIR